MALGILDWLQLFGIFGEVIIAGIGIAIGMRSRSWAGWYIGISFALYAMYDFIQLGRTLKIWAVNMPLITISLIYLVAVVFMVLGIWKIYRALD